MKYTIYTREQVRVALTGIGDAYPLNSKSTGGYAHGYKEASIPGVQGERAASITIRMRGLDQDALNDTITGILNRCGMPDGVRRMVRGGFLTVIAHYSS